MPSWVDLNILINRNRRNVCHSASALELSKRVECTITQILQTTSWQAQTEFWMENTKHVTNVFAFARCGSDSYVSLFYDQAKEVKWKLQIHCSKPAVCMLSHHRTHILTLTILVSTSMGQPRSRFIIP